MKCLYRGERMQFSEDEVEMIREFLSAVACGYERETYYFHCCEAAELIRKIDGDHQSEG